ncbi:hypothetical protein ACQCT3_00690 [Sutcliffiella horikoshii]|uniref:hypothetical protein n=1 Tax=Sutcliffiella horikoshii TaxID=79883 RepID=UPI003CF74840
MMNEDDVKKEMERGVLLTKELEKQLGSLTFRLTELNLEVNLLVKENDELKRRILELESSEQSK